MGKALPFRWYGGKYSHLDFILPQLPKTEQYVEPFGGSAAVLINREPSPVETYNDIDGDVVNFFKVLRENRDELLEKISLTPFSREELANAVEKKSDGDLSDIERARLFFVRAGQTRSGLAQEATPGRWAYCKSTSRRNMSGAVSRWHGRLEQLYDVADRLRRVQIENLPAIEVVERHDDEDALFYCDPPYVHSSRGDTNSYGYEMTDEDHRELAEVLRSCEGKVAVSGYQCDLYEELFEGHAWHRVDSEEKTMHTTKDTRVESLWLNYEPPNRDVSPGIDKDADQATLFEAADE
ncbi:DNA adenine methylase [Natronobiforma cellulositropha]|uniref:DNA adenine methylase n=1 Tax=Natronobiforma cellulositropha TaxID=1679076 RepID=UPI0021D60F42|nr:DNA adenine methylase [Natronobiforma cellulositropha]